VLLLKILIIYSLFPSMINNNTNVVIHLTIIYRCKVLDEPGHVRPGTSAQRARETDRRSSKKHSVLLRRRNVYSNGDRSQSAHGTVIRQRVSGRKCIADVWKLPVHRAGQGTSYYIICNMYYYSSVYARTSKYSKD